MIFISAILCKELELPCLDLQAKGRDPGHSHIGLYWKSNYLGYFPNEFHV